MIMSFCRYTKTLYKNDKELIKINFLMQQEEVEEVKDSPLFR